METIAIVHWQPESYNSELSFHFMATEPACEDVAYGTGVCLRDIFKFKKISPEEAMRAFPDTIIPANKLDKGWDSCFAMLYIESSPRTLKRFAKMVQMPVVFFVADKRRGSPYLKGLVYKPN